MLGLFKPKKKIGQARILVVDDENDIVSTIQFRLKSCGFDILTADNGQEGIETATREKPDLILLDINMPIMDGHTMLQRVRSHSELKDTPVIMLTAYSDRNDISKAAELGISDYVTKPFDFSDLMEKISKALGGNTSD
jgi:DNA-binding response OmpR family regulator